jgi:hypothetical protein
VAKSENCSVNSFEEFKEMKNRSLPQEANKHKTCLGEGCLASTLCCKFAKEGKNILK